MRQISFVKCGLAAAIATVALGGISQAAVLTDSFGASHDYAGGSTAGTIWSGTVNAGNSTVFNSNTSNAGQLTVSTNSNVGLDGGANSSPILYVTANGDFTADVQVTGFSPLNTNYINAGLVVRSAAGTSGNEHFLLASENNFSTGPFVAPWNSSRSVSGSSQTDSPAFNNGTGQAFLRIQRVGNALTAYSSPDGSAGSYAAIGPVNTDASLSGSVQVGLYFATFDAINNAAVTFDNFSLTTVPEPTLVGLAGVGACGVLRRRRLAR